MNTVTSRPHEHAPFKSSVTFCAVIGILVSGCVSPRPQSFVDADALPHDFVGRQHQAFARGDRLIVEVMQIPGFNVVGFDAFEQDGALYVSPRNVSSGGGGMAQFEIDVSKFRLGSDWPHRVYWLLQEYAYPIGHPGFWSPEKRSPWPRR